jgi:6-phosphofructokinase 2
MTDIFTITLNPALDISTAVDQVRPGPKLRCDAPQADPGGGGINVSRAIRRLGGDSLAFVALGGATGQRLASLLTAEGLRFELFPVEDETRQSVAVTDRATGGQYRFVMPGPNWSPAMVDNALAAIGIGVGRDSLVVISGSNPPGVPEDFTARLTLRLAGTGARVIADTSGPALRHLVNNPCKINVLRMDAAEAEDLAGRSMPTREDSALFAGTLVRKGVAETVIIARGADGSTLVSKGKAIHCARPITEIVSAVGAGDSFVGAFALALARGMDLAESLRHGTAAASAAVLTEATQLCTPEDAERLLPGCELTEI